MAISIFQIQHKSVTREVVVDKITFSKGDQASAYVFAHTRPVITDDELQTSGERIQSAEFDQTEIVTAMKEIATTLGITITPAQLGQIILGLPEQLIRNRFEDA